jgi:hypothetical protein
LPIRNGLGPSFSGGPTKPLVHPAMRYAPSSSSPLSSRLAPPPSVDTQPSSSNHLTTGAKRLSAQSHLSTPVSILSQNTRRMSSAYLNLVPSQTYVDSETLMRILRGPSSYPEEFSFLYIFYFLLFYVLSMCHSLLIRACFFL